MRSNSRLNSVYMAGASVLAMALCAPSAAQDAEPAGDSDARRLNSVIVTATKRDESIQDVPIAVTAISGEELERAGVADIRSLGNLSPSFNMNSSQTESQGATLRLRGVGTTGNNIGLESSVGVFLDGVYLSRPGVALTDLFDLEQIEVLRGPQGTLFGRNTSAGALNIKTKAPDLETPEAWLNLELGNYDSRVIQAGGSYPIIEDVLAVRVAGAVRQRDGFSQSVTDGNRTRDRDRYSLKAQALWEPTDEFSLRLIADYSESDERCCDAVVVSETSLVDIGAYAAVGLPADGGITASGPPGSSTFDNAQTNSLTWENSFEQWGISAEANWDLGFANATYIGSYRDFYAFSIQDSEYTSLDVYDVPFSFDEILTSSHEARLQGEWGNLDWLVGLYYSDEEIEEQAILELGDAYTQYNSAVAWTGGLLPIIQGADAAAGGTVLPALSAVPLATGGTLGDVFASSNPALAFAGGVDAAGSFAHNQYLQETQTFSIFTHNTFSVTDQLDLVLGLRWNDEKKDGAFNQIDAESTSCNLTLANAGAVTAGTAGTPLADLGGLISAFTPVFYCFPFAAEAGVVPGFSPTEFDDTFEDDELTYTAKAVYKFDIDKSVYASFSHGFKSGGFNLDSTAAIGNTPGSQPGDPGDPRFRSEIVDAYELGLKSEFFNNRVRANVAIFLQEMEDFQVLEFTGVQFVTFNVPEAESKGVEVELLAAATDNLTLNTSITYADANYSGDCPDVQVSTPDFLCDGVKLTNAPEWVAVYGGTYERDLGADMTGFINISARYEDERRTSTAPDLEFDIQDANTKINLRAGIGAADGGWALEFWGNNITDEITRNVTFSTPLRGTSAFADFGIPTSVNSQSRSAFLEDPRTYGMTLRVRR